MPENNSNIVEEDYMDDDLFDYDADVPDIDTTIKDPTPEKKSEKKKDNLGLDEEVKIRKKRINVKLDEARLLRDDIGIPKLRREAPRRLKFKGKGYEYRDAARLLSYYQLWADDLYKKAKFRDTLQIIEKLGHARSMKQQREGWIMESRKQGGNERGGTQDEDLEYRRDREGQFANAVLGALDAGVPPNDDDLYSRPTGTGAPAVSNSGALFLGGPDSDSSEDNFGPDDDELEALMLGETGAANADAAPSTSTGKEQEATKTPPIAPPVDEFADEMEAMAEFGDDW